MKFCKGCFSTVDWDFNKTEIITKNHTQIFPEMAKSLMDKGYNSSQH